MNRRTQEARSEAIARHIILMLHELRMTPAKWSIDVVEHYHARVPVEARRIAFATVGDADKIARANGQTIKRFWEHSAPNAMRMPSDIEESLVACLREPYRNQCEAELLRRTGFLPVRIPSSCGSGDVHSLACITQEFGQALEAVAPTLADGKIDAADLPYIPAALRELDDLIAATTSLRVRLAEQLAAGGADA